MSTMHHDFVDIQTEETKSHAVQIMWATDGAVRHAKKGT